MHTLVIGDLHGNWSGLSALLRESGAVDAEGLRNPDWRIIQLGDLIHGGRPRHPERPGVDDDRCLLAGLHYCDTILIGNHELPHVWPDAGFPTFSGQRAIRDHMRAKLLAAYDRGQLVPATHVDDWLLTHAGLSGAFVLAGYDAGFAAERLCHFFTERLERKRPQELFDGIGFLRGGNTEYGGIFWCDWQELLRSVPRIKSPQIVGHTPQGTAPRQHGNLWGCDVGAALSGLVCGLVRREGGEWEPLVVESVAGAEAA